jgi:SAM-dependent methyltransferase
MGELLRFKDIRVQQLWCLSDTKLLKIVHERYPDILSDEEWATIEANQEMCLQGLDHYAESPNHNWDFTPERTDWEWAALTSSFRWRGVQEILWGRQPGRAMDFGCHTGAHAVAMSNWWPDAKVYGREIVADLAPGITYTIQKYASTPQNVQIDIGDHRFPAMPTDLDLLFAGEVFEHMWEWREFLVALEASCKPGAQMVITVPNGPWEMTNDRHIHVAHWELPDLYEVFAHHREQFRTIEVSVAEPNKWPLGWIVATWAANPGAPLGEINIERKLHRYGFQPDPQLVTSDN